MIGAQSASYSLVCALEVDNWQVTSGKWQKTSTGQWKLEEKK
jgi:hypothetical protein